MLHSAQKKNRGTAIQTSIENNHTSSIQHNLVLIHRKSGANLGSVGKLCVAISELPKLLLPNLFLFCLNMAAIRVNIWTEQLTPKKLSQVYSDINKLIAEVFMKLILVFNNGPSKRKIVKQTRFCFYNQPVLILKTRNTLTKYRYRLLYCKEYPKSLDNDINMD